MSVPPVRNARRSAAVFTAAATLVGWFLLLAVAPWGCAGVRAPAKIAPPAAVAAPEAPAVVVAPQKDWSDAVLYFALLDRFADGDPSNDVHVDPAQKGTFHGGDLAGLQQHLDDLADLGVTAIWINPVVKNIPGFVTGAGFPDWAYHGYWADDFYQTDFRFGSEAQLKMLVEDCHRRGIKVLLDVVYNHVGYDSQYLTNPRTKGWIRNPCGSDDLTTCVGGLPDLRTELPEVAEFLYEAHLGRAQRVGLDGFRLDTVKHVDHPFWQEHRRRTRERLGKSFFLVGEVWGGDAQSLDPWFEGDEMDAGFDFSFQGSVLGFLLGRGRTVAFDRYLKSREKVRAGHYLAHFLSSHDVPGLLWQLGGDKQAFRLAAILEFTSPGIPTIYYGEEVGRLGGDWPDNRSDMPWGERQVRPGAGLPRDEALRSDYKRLIAIRRAHPALSRGIHAPLSTEGDLLVFVQRDPASGDAVVVAVNRGSAPATARFDTPPEWSTAAVRDLWNGEDVPTAGGAIETEVNPKSARILAVR
ncbi:MAG: DUF3459 domain-containing protein [Acidobacteriia bacterium]|nr:DUF3459 domain-containing protein [Terriglobia bacterium]